MEWAATLPRQRFDRVDARAYGPFGLPRNEISTCRPDDIAVVQSLELLNGADLHRFVYDGEMLDELASQSDREKVINELYWSLLNREPTGQETQLGLAYLKNGSRG